MDERLTAAVANYRAKTKRRPIDDEMKTDVDILADAFLASIDQAADDAELIDEQFIYSLAEQYEAEANELNYPRIQLRGGEMSLEWSGANESIEARVVFEDHVGGTDRIEIDLPHIKTRAQLRQLVKLLRGE